MPCTSTTARIGLPPEFWPWGLAAALLCIMAWAAPRLPTPTPLDTVKIGIDAGAMPLHNGIRNYTEDGLEVMLATELAQHLGATAVLVPLPSKQAIRVLEQGEVDIVLLQQPRHERLPSTVNAIPTGWHTQWGVTMRSDTSVRRWADLAGRVVCATQGNALAQAQGQKVGGHLQVFAAPAQALVAVRTGICDAAVFDRWQLDALFQRKEWNKFSASLPSSPGGRLVAAVSAERPDIVHAVQTALMRMNTYGQWQQRRAKWAANVAFEVYFDQIGPDCH